MKYLLHFLVFLHLQTAAVKADTVTSTTATNIANNQISARVAPLTPIYPTIFVTNFATGVIGIGSALSGINPAQSNALNSAITNTAGTQVGIAASDIALKSAGNTFTGTNKFNGPTVITAVVSNSAPSVLTGINQNNPGSAITNGYQVWFSSTNNPPPINTNFIFLATSTNSPGWFFVSSNVGAVGVWVKK